jgi:hypothetical protein
VLKNLATIASMRFLVPALATGLFCCVFSAHSQTAQPPSVSPSEPVPAVAAPSRDFWRLMASPYTFHYSRDPEHRPVRMIGLERQRADGIVFGGTYFSNSFGQPSTYLYGGQRLENWSDYSQLFAQWTAGVLYGYKGEFKDKVPFNHGGFSPGLVLSMGWQFTPVYSAQVNVLGNSALMFQVSVDLP